MAKTDKQKDEFISKTQPAPRNHLRPSAWYLEQVEERAKLRKQGIYRDYDNQISKVSL